MRLIEKSTMTFELFLSLCSKDIHKHKATRSKSKVTVISDLPSDVNNYFNSRLFVFRISSPSPVGMKRRAFRSKAS